MPRTVEVGTHCPANKAADIVGDRWVLQILRAMMLGATRYGELKQAIPRVSPTVLSGRLKQLADQGMIVRRQPAGAKAATYRLTASGRELEPVIRQLAVWGMRWARRNLREREIDVGALMWDVHKSLRTSELPDGETVFSVSLSDVERFSKWWIVANGNSVDLCSDNPGKDVDLYLSCPLSVLVEIWRGERPVRHAIAEGDVMIDGAPDLIRTVEDWIPISPVAREA